MTYSEVVEPRFAIVSVTDAAGHQQTAGRPLRSKANPNELAGHFSTTIIDPTTGQPFPNNTIPTSRNSRLANVALANKWFPAPNADSPLGNYSVVRTLPQKQNQFTVRIDQELGHFGRAFVRYTDTRYENRQTTGNVLDISDQIFVQNAKNWQVSHTWPIRNNVVNSFRFGRVWADAPLKPIPCAQSAIDAAANTGIFQNIPDDALPPELRDTAQTPRLVNGVRH